MVVGGFESVTGELARLPMYASTERKSFLARQPASLKWYFMCR